MNWIKLLIAALAITLAMYIVSHLGGGDSRWMLILASYLLTTGGLWIARSHD